ncbi:MAG TPA: hypothetical protein VJV40_06955 [Thermodesulfobacteriota bacterium]|nr:hypothetical protein [Thermodesulfobacteriota bacterium]
MLTLFASKSFKAAVTSIAMLLALVFLAQGGIAGETMTSAPFTGTKVNGGTVTLTKEGDKTILTLSDDFVVPQTPDPHWQVVDSKGNVYLLQRLPTKGDKVNKSITLPSYVSDVAKVQIWCAYAESLLGEAPFASHMN